MQIGKSPLVSCTWLNEHLPDQRLTVVEVGVPEGFQSEHSRYLSGHIPNAVWLDSVLDLRNPRSIGALEQDLFEELMAAKGISETDVVILYSADNNIWSTSAYWLFRLYCHASVKVLDGGRTKWEQLGYPLSSEIPVRSPVKYAAPGRDDSIRALRSEVMASLGKSVFVDAREPEEYSGKTFSPDQGPNAMGGQRTGHIPDAINVPWRLAANADETFKDVSELNRIYSEAGFIDCGDAITYCWVGARSAYSWFVLNELMGIAGVRNYDGSWAEYGSSVGAPIAT